MMIGESKYNHKLMGYRMLINNYTNKSKQDIWNKNNKKHVEFISKTYFPPRKRTNKLRNISPTGKNKKKDDF